MSAKHFTLNKSSQLQQGYSIGIQLLINTKYLFIYLFKSFTKYGRATATA
jgi:hypothetical protein